MVVQHHSYWLHHNHTLLRAMNCFLVWTTSQLGDRGITLEQSERRLCEKGAESRYLAWCNNSIQCWRSVAPCLLGQTFCFCSIKTVRKHKPMSTDCYRQKKVSVFWLVSGEQRHRSVLDISHWLSLNKLSFWVEAFWFFEVSDFLLSAMQGVKVCSVFQLPWQAHTF